MTNACFRRLRNERGAVLVHVTVAIIGLLAFSALVIDYGVMWSAAVRPRTRPMRRTGRRDLDGIHDAGRLRHRARHGAMRWVPRTRVRRRAEHRPGQRRRCQAIADDISLSHGMSQRRIALRSQAPNETACASTSTATQPRTRCRRSSLACRMPIAGRAGHGDSRGLGGEARRLHASRGRSRTDGRSTSSTIRTQTGRSPRRTTRCGDSWLDTIDSIFECGHGAIRTCRPDGNTNPGTGLGLSMRTAHGRDYGWSSR